MARLTDEGIEIPTSIGAFGFDIFGSTKGIAEFEYRPPRSRRSFKGNFMIERTDAKARWRIAQWTMNSADWPWRTKPFDYASSEEFHRHASAATRAVPESAANTVYRVMTREVIPWLAEHEHEFIAGQLRRVCEQEVAPVIRDLHKLVGDGEGLLDCTLESIADRVVVIKECGRLSTPKTDQLTIQAYHDLVRARASLAALGKAWRTKKAAA